MSEVYSYWWRITGQAGALVHGISKALFKFDENLKSTLKKEKLNNQRL